MLFRDRKWGTFFNSDLLNFPFGGFGIYGWGSWVVGVFIFGCYWIGEMSWGADCLFDESGVSSTQFYGFLGSVYRKWNFYLGIDGNLGRNLIYLLTGGLK